ncbi:1-acyl-sn-glycerol-3-phosphate acyltransferase [Arthrobacter yangruifuii]|uniref:1-acyl-sn-glycerol-3-phosphate acyltransferase n=1 Tax=Arthrobacter yangruifuii TaxID=2606616 RepID=A0A5N6MR53_9MICC|nr:lysophospholipid acyltransferase family protein [Arthrobacter yangruifuii]KAD4007135.1 1-acyl-sn-glycerol-3-phosphate acyltransferase [Arthrobacter yangruifuii]
MTESTKARVVFALLAGTLRPIFNIFLKKQWQGAENLPRDPGFIVCPNHVTEIDPVVVGHFLYNQGRSPHFLAKASLFKVPVLGPALSATNQVPVERITSGAAGSLDAARAALEAGRTLVIYPEGTLTRDPDLWPMKGRTGAARLALQTGAPVIPIAHWGAQDAFPRYAKFPNLFPRKRVRLVVGKPVDLSEFAGLPTSKAVLDAATERIMSDLTDMVSKLRGAQPPAERWNPVAKGQRQVGRSFETGSAGSGTATTPTEPEAGQ